MAEAAQPNVAGAVAPGKVNPWKLAHAGGRWVGEVPAERFRRLATVVCELGETAQVDLRFTLHAGGGCEVAGTARVMARLLCERCLNDKPCELFAEIDSLAVVGEEAAEGAAAQGREICVLAGKETSLEALVEDDFLLSLPTRVCPEPEHCPDAPALSFGPQGLSSAALGLSSSPPSAARPNPFAALRGLRHASNVEDREPNLLEPRD